MFVFHLKFYQIPLVVNINCINDLEVFPNNFLGTIT